MTANPLLEVQKYGQSIWMDYIKRSLIISGKLDKLVHEGIVGMTSNRQSSPKHAIRKNTMGLFLSCLT